MTKLTPMKAIRSKCLDCCCGQAKEVRLCTVDTCPLFPFRMGHRPKEGNASDKPSSSENIEIDGSFFSNEVMLGGDV